MRKRNVAILKAMRVVNHVCYNVRLYAFLPDMIFSLRESHVDGSFGVTFLFTPVLPLPAFMNPAASFHTRNNRAP